MIIPESFHFLRPLWLLAFIPLVIIVWLLINRRKNSGSWQAICDPVLLPHILIGSEKRQTRWSTIFIGLVGILGIIALAGPVWTQLPQPVFRSQSSLVIVLDLSRSMDASDIKPSRIARARHKILDILDRRKEGQTALVVFAQDAFTVAPLTQDAKTIAALVKTLSPGLMPGQGSNTSLGLVQASDLLQQAGAKQGNILLVTDGADDIDTLSSVKDLTGNGHRVSVLAVGTETGAPIPTGSGGFLKDRNGEIVVPRLIESDLRTIASDGNGTYRLLVSTDDDIERLLATFSDNSTNRKADEGNRQLNVQADVWQEEGPWLLLLVIPFAALAFRRGYLLALLVCILPIPEPAFAFEWADLWQTKDQRAAEAYAEGRHRQAADLFNDPEWEAAAHYKAENYDASVSSLGGITTPDALYNQATALARSGAIEEAIEYYDRTLEIDPAHEDAIFNRDLLLKHQEQKEQQKEDQKDKNDQEQQGEGQKSNQQSQGGQKEQQGEGDDSGDQSKSQANNSSDSEKQNAEQDDNAEQSVKQKDQKENDAREDETGKKQMAQQEDEAGKTEDKSDKSKKKSGKNSEAMDKKQLEMQMANEQWLRRIPDDPGGLLRRKFRYQSQLNQRQSNQESRPW